MIIIGASNSVLEASCTQEELLSIASAVSGLVNLPDLAKCLGISSSTLDDMDEGDTIRDKALKLFLMWQSTNCGENSKAKLFACLQQLNNASINEILIKQYAG